MIVKELTNSVKDMQLQKSLSIRLIFTILIILGIIFLSLNQTTYLRDCSSLVGYAQFVFPQIVLLIILLTCSIILYSCYLCCICPALPSQLSRYLLRLLISQSHQISSQANKKQMICTQLDYQFGFRCLQHFEIIFLPSHWLRDNLLLKVLGCFQMLHQNMHSIRHWIFSPLNIWISQISSFCSDTRLFSDITILNSISVPTIQLTHPYSYTYPISFLIN